MQVIDWSAAAALHCAEIRTQLEADGLPVGLDDMMIAASALTINATLITNNIRHFSRIPNLKLENWLKARG